MNCALTSGRFYVSFSGLAVALFSLPFSVKVCHLGIIIFLIAWASENNWTEKMSIVKESILLQLLGCFFLLNLIGLLYTQNLTDGWFIIEKKIFLFLLPLALATTAIKLSDKNILSLLYVFTFSCFIGSVICIVKAVNSLGTGSFNDYLSTTTYASLNPETSKAWMVFSYVSIADGIDIHPAFFSLYLAFCLVFIFVQLQKEFLTIKYKILLWLLIVYFSIFIVCLSSRIMILSLLIISIFFIAREFRYATSKVHAVIVTVLAIALTFVLYLNPVSRYRNIQEVSSTPISISTNESYRNSIQIRLSLWWLALRSVNASNLLVGSGTGDVEDVMTQSGNRYSISNILNSHDPHNQYLFTLLSHGLVGLAILILNFGVPMYFIWQQRDYLYLAFAFLCVSICVTESAFELQKGIAFFSLVSPLLLLRLNAFKKLRLTNAI